MTFCNFVSMNSECYTTEYRPYLSPKGRVYLKVDNEGKPDLKTFDSSFFLQDIRPLPSTRTLIHTYTTLLFVRAYQSPIEICFKHVICFASHLFFFILKRSHSHHVLSSSITVIYRNALVRTRCRLTACYIDADTAQSPAITWLRDSISPHFYSSRTHLHPLSLISISWLS